MQTQDWKKQKILTGDNGLCSGNELLSQTIKVFNKANGGQGFAAEMTHVFKFVWIKGVLYVFESTTLNEWCGKSGVQINEFEHWLKYYNGEVYWQPVRTEDQINAKEKHHLPDYMICDCESYAEDFTKVRLSLYGTPYESGLGGLIELMTAFEKAEQTDPDKLDDRARTAEVHCSEANIIVDQAGGRFNKHILASKMPPMRFVDGTYEENLINCSTGGNIIRLK